MPVFKPNQRHVFFGMAKWFPVAHMWLAARPATCSLIRALRLCYERFSTLTKPFDSWRLNLQELPSRRIGVERRRRKGSRSWWWNGGGPWKFYIQNVNSLNSVLQSTQCGSIAGSNKQEGLGPNSLKWDNSLRALQECTSWVASKSGGWCRCAKPIAQQWLWTP